MHSNLKKNKRINLLRENGETNLGAERGGGLLQYFFLVLRVDGISISDQMAKHRSAVAVFCQLQNIASACNAGGSSSLHTRMNAAVRLMQPLRCGATHLKTSQRCLQHASYHTAHASTGTTSAAHSTARAPLQPHLHSLYATPRHTLHYPGSPAPRRLVDHVHTGRRGGQSLARERHTAEHAAYSPTRTIYRENGAEGRQRCLPTVQSLRKKPRLGLDELERAHDLRAKLRGRLQFAVGNEGK